MVALSLPVSESELSALALRRAGGDHHLADEMAQHVRVQHFRGLFDPARSAFPTWASWCMRNYGASARRTHFTAAGGDAVADHPDDSDPSPDFAIDLTTPFGAGDLFAVRSWRPRPRLVLLAYAGLWNKLPPADQHATVRGAKPAVADDLTQLRDLVPGECRAELAAILGVAPNSISQILVRGLPLVRDLRFVRELLGE